VKAQDCEGRAIPTQCGQIVISGTTGDEDNYYPGNAAAHIHAFLEVLRAIGRTPDTTPNIIDAVRALVLMAKEWRPLDSQWLDSRWFDADAALPSVADGANAELTEKQAAEAGAAKKHFKKRPAGVMKKPAGVMKKPAGAKPEPAAAGAKEEEEEVEAEEEHAPPRDLQGWANGAMALLAIIEGVACEDETADAGAHGEGEGEGEEAEATPPYDEPVGEAGATPPCDEPADERADTGAHGEGEGEGEEAEAPPLYDEPAGEADTPPPCDELADEA
jgi:hypothetical protein